MPFTPLGLDHVVLRVRDQAATQAFYIDVLGCTLERINAPLSLIHLRFGEQLIDILPGNGDTGQGMDHVCLSIRCDDLGKVAEELRARGVKLEGDVRDRFGAYGSGPSLYFRDPDGYRIELKPR
jgi:catechol 2,3-dioxygenase-like lactoylglutathione lyase family enzyme